MFLVAQNITAFKVYLFLVGLSLFYYGRISESWLMRSKGMLNTGRWRVRLCPFIERIGPNAWGNTVFGQIGVAIVILLRMISIIPRALLLHRFYLIVPWPNSAFRLLVWKPLYCWAKELIFVLFEMRKMWGYLIGAWAWLIVFKLDHFPELGFDGIVSLVDLGFEMRFDGFRGEHSRRSYLLVPLVCYLRHRLLFLQLSICLFDQRVKPLLLV